MHARAPGFSIIDLGTVTRGRREPVPREAPRVFWEPVAAPHPRWGKGAAGGGVVRKLSEGRILSDGVLLSTYEVFSQKWTE